MNKKIERARLFYFIRKDFVQCVVCDEIFNRKDDWQGHIIKYHVNECLQCRHCKQLFICYSDQNKHECIKTT
jgi:hypothetical protein